MLKTYDQQIEEVDKEDKEETSATDEDGDDDPARHIGGNLAEGMSNRHQRQQPSR